MKKAFFGILIMIFSGSLALTVVNSPVAEAKDCNQSSYVFGLPTWYRGLTTGDKCEMKKISEKDNETKYQIHRIIKEKITLDILQDFKTKLQEYVESV